MFDLGCNFLLCDFKLGLLNKAHQDYISPPYLIRDGLFILIAFKISQ